MIWDAAIKPNANLALRFAKNQSAVTAIEYGLITACVALAIWLAAQEAGTVLNTVHGCGRQPQRLTDSDTDRTK